MSFCNHCAPTNIIILQSFDFDNSLGFGASRLDEFQGKHKLDVVFVYGIEVATLTQAPGGRDNAFMVSKATFELLSQPNESGNYFLRSDRILGIFSLDPANPLRERQEAYDALKTEQAEDKAIKEKILKSIQAREVIGDAITEQVSSNIDKVDIEIDFAETASLKKIIAVQTSAATTLSSDRLIEEDIEAIIDSAVKRVAIQRSRVCHVEKSTNPQATTIELAFHKSQNKSDILLFSSKGNKSLGATI